MNLKENKISKFLAGGRCITLRKSLDSFLFLGSSHEHLVGMRLMRFKIKAKDFNPFPNFELFCFSRVYADSDV